MKFSYLTISSYIILLSFIIVGVSDAQAIRIVIPEILNKKKTKELIRTGKLPYNDSLRKGPMIKKVITKYVINEETAMVEKLKVIFC